MFGGQVTRSRALVGQTYTEANRSHGRHGEDVQPGMSQPLAKPGTGRHGVWLVVVAGGTVMSVGGRYRSRSRGRTIARPPIEETHGS